MRLLTSPFLLLPSLILATTSSASSNNDVLSLQTISPTEEVATRISNAPHSEHTTTSSPSPQTSHMNNLELRDPQGVGAAGGTVGELPVETQMSPTTIYLVRGPNGQQTPMPYTQLFVKVPEQWPSPTPGTIGLGTIQGQIGVVKTKSKRSVAVPTERAGRLVKRKKKSGSSGESSAAGLNVPVFGVGVVFLFGLGAVGLL